MGLELAREVMMAEMEFIARFSRFRFCFCELKKCVYVCPVSLVFLIDSANWANRLGLQFLAFRLLCG
nr:hypothetical protein Iba_chr13bCG7970 [Ipomoea batatas]